MHMFGGYGTMGFGGFGMLFMVLFWGVIIALIVVLVRKVGTTSDSDKDNAPVDIIKQRYAKGGISKQEFDRLMTELK